MKTRLAMLATALVAAACTPLAPTYVRPDMHLPTAWKSAPDDAVVPAGTPQWRLASPADEAPRRDWWTVFADPALDALEARCLRDNPTLQGALARLDQAQAQARAREAAQAPTLQAGAGVTRARTSADRPLGNYAVPNQSTVQNDMRPVLTVGYEFDWLGRLRLDAQSARLSAEQSAADLENVRLLLTAQVADSYLQARQLDDEMAVLAAAIALQDKVLGLMTQRYAEGASARADLASQTALLESTRAQWALLKLRRAQQEDALATLSGEAAASFHLPVGRLTGALPTLPVALPSTLLQRRPDVASAERAMMAANAQIGVARAAYYPSLLLAPTLWGSESSTLARLGSAPSILWAVGLAGAQTLWDGGRVDAAVASARAHHADTLAAYRQSVLAAVQEVQDALSTLQDLDQAARRQDAAVRAQAEAARISGVRYREGLDNAVALATTELNRLTAERTRSQIVGQQFIATVALVKALGGGWSGLDSGSALSP